MKLMSKYAVYACMLILCLAFPSCVKEDRSICPCILILDFSDTDPDGLHDGVLMSLYGNDYGFRENMRIPQGEYVRTVPKGQVDVSVFAGIAGSEICGDSLLTGYGNGSDRIFAHSGSLDASGEIARDRVVLNKQFAVLNIILVDKDPDMEYPYDITVKGNVCGFDIRSMSPVGGAFSATASEEMPGGNLSVAVPRQKDDSLLMEIVSHEDGKIDNVINLGEYIREKGFDWTKESLDDLNIILDCGSAEISVDIKPWIVYKKDILI